MTKLEELLDILLKDMISEDKQDLRNRITKTLCAHSLRNMNPNEIDSTKTFVKSQDNKRFYIGVTTKKGIELTVPLEKEHFSDKRISYLTKLA